MVDPIESLPFEVIVQIFSLLSTPDISISASTNKKWRNVVLTDPVINKVIDLKDLRLSEDEIIRLVRRLFSISTHPEQNVKRALHLNLDSFWRVFLDFYKVNDQPLSALSLMKETDSKYVELIEEISSTRNRLTKLFIHINKEMSLGNRNSFLTGSIIDTLWHLDSSEKSLINEVRFSIPFPISVQAERKDQDGKTAKLFSIGNVCKEPLDDYSKNFDSVTCKYVLQDAVTFTAGGGLIELTLNMTRFATHLSPVQNREDDRSLFLEIEKSRETLECLNLKFDSMRSLSDVFDLIVNLPSLTLLEFSLASEEENLWLDSPVPKQTPVFHLGSLQIWSWESETEKLDWLVDWVGPDLKEFTLYLSSNPLRSRFSEVTLSSILKTCNLSLTELILGQLSLSNCSDTPLARDFPNLEYLSIECLSLSGYAILAGCSMPKLQDFAYAHSILGDESGFLTEEEASIQAVILQRSSRDAA